MEQEPHIHPTVTQPVERLNGFWPVLLLGISLLMIFFWEIWVGVRYAAQRATAAGSTSARRRPG
jgi:hypothetical protein